MPITIKKIQRTNGKIGKRLGFEMHDDGGSEIYSSNMNDLYKKAINKIS